VTALVLFCGAGGSSLGVHEALPGACVVGIDHDADSCRTHQAAGFGTVRADIASLGPERFASFEGIWLSPPCTAFSSAGKREGIDQVPAVLAYLRTWQPSDGLAWHGKDPLVWLVTEPLRWVLVARPQWVVLEQVPQVLPIWQATERRMRQAGYWTWCGVLNAADYSVPQTRRRALLLASRLRPVQPPEPTHAEHPVLRLDGTQASPWVSMAEALGIDPGWNLEQIRGAGMNERHGERPPRLASKPAFTVTGSESGSALRRWRFRAGPQSRATERPVTKPAPTIVAATDNGGTMWVLDTRRSQRPDGSTQRAPLDAPAPTVTTAPGMWIFDRPATTVMGTPRVSPPDAHHPYQGQGHASTRSIMVTLDQLAALQDFPPSYRFVGNKSSVSRQIGNAVPRSLARACVAAVAGVQKEAVA